jgi:hypothetical protein
MKKIALILIILALPMIARAQEQTKNKANQVTIDNLDWTVPETHGLLIEVSADSLCFEECWMRILPGSESILDQSNDQIGIAQIQAPCLVDISYGGKGRNHYIISLKVVSEQLPTDRNGDVILPRETFE